MLKEQAAAEEYSLQPYWGEVPAAHDQGLRALCLAIFDQAVSDARVRNPDTRRDALEWLEVEGPEWLDLLGYGIRREKYQEFLTRLKANHEQLEREKQEEQKACDMIEFWAGLSGALSLYTRQAGACLLS